MSRSLLWGVALGLASLTVRADVTPNDPGVVGADYSASIQNAVDLAVKRGEKCVIPGFNTRTGTNLWVFTKAVKLPSRATAFGRTEDFGSGCHYFCKNPPDYFW